MSIALSRTNLDKLTMSQMAKMGRKGALTEMDVLSVAASSVFGSTKSLVKRPPLPVDQAWKEKDSLKVMISEAHANR
jgi:hypothetical protein